MVVFLTRKNKVKIIFQRRDAAHSDAEKVFNQVGMRRNEFLGPAGLDGVLADVTFESEPHHIAAHRQGNALRAGMRAAARSQDQFLDLARMVEGEQLRDHATHGMPADNRLLGIQTIEQCRGIVGEHFDGVLLYGLARFSRAAVVKHNYPMITRKFADLVKFPRLMIETRDAAEQKWWAIAVNLVVDLRVLAFEKGHKFFFRWHQSNRALDYSLAPYVA